MQFSIFLSFYLCVSVFFNFTVLANNPYEFNDSGLIEAQSKLKSVSISNSMKSKSRIADSKEESESAIEESKIESELSKSKLKHKPKVQKPIVVIIPSYNNSQWVSKNIESVFQQKYSNYRIIYINDCSADDTALEFDKCVSARNIDYKIIYFDNEGSSDHPKNTQRFIDLLNGEKPFVTFVQNLQRNGSLSNFYRSIMSCDDKEIVVVLDGDDWFYHDKVLKDVNEVYSGKKTVWTTHGRLITYPTNESTWCLPIPDDVVKTNTFRSYRCPSYFRSFYVWLFKKIKLEDLLYEGEFFPVTGDLAVMFPIFEMAGERHHFFKKINYVYNISNPINDYKVNRERQLFFDQYIRAMPPYQRLK